MKKDVSKILAKFIGEDGSMGLRKGKLYNVSVYTMDNYIWVDWGMNRCPYSSFGKLEENWEWQR